MTRWARIAVVLMVLALVAGYVAGSGHWSGTSPRNNGPAESGEANAWLIEVEWATAASPADATRDNGGAGAAPAAHYTIVVTVPPAEDEGR